MQGSTRTRIQAGFQHNTQYHQHPTHYNHQRLKREIKRHVLKGMPRKREPSKEKQNRIPRIPNSQRRCNEKYILHGKGFILNEFETCSRSVGQEDKMHQVPVASQNSPKSYTTDQFASAKVLLFCCSSNGLLLSHCCHCCCCCCCCCWWWCWWCW